MLINIGKHVTLSPPNQNLFNYAPSRVDHLKIDHSRPSSFVLSHQTLSSFELRGFITLCCAIRRRVRFENDDDNEEYGRNEEIAMLESYSQRVREELLLVNALVDDSEVEVLIYKGFSSCLSYETSPDPSRSILPARAKIKSIDRVKGPFDPSKIEYLQKGITWEDFKTNFLPN